MLPGMDESSTVRLTALSGTPLDDAIVRATVEATARAIAERTGVPILSLSIHLARITVVLEADRVAAIGFAAELRRLTNNWYASKFRDGPLWGTPPPDLPPPGTRDGWDEL